MRGFAARATVMILALASVSIPAEAGETLRRYEFAESHMGSEFKIVLYSPDAPTARSASRLAFDRIAELDRSFSDYQPDSELMRLCDKSGGPPVKVSDDLFEILVQSKAMYERSEGAFDVTVGPVVRLWRRARRERKLPSAENLEHAKRLVSSDFMTLDRGTQTVTLAKAGMKLDLGAIAKGYACDAALKVLKERGISRCLVAGAGDIGVAEPPPDAVGWVVGIAPLENPESAPERQLLLKNVAVSTSGDTERFVEINGKRYSHIVDPKTGLGKVDRASVTIIAKDGTTADALATAVYGLGPERGLRLVEATEGAAAYIVRATETGKSVVESKRFREFPKAEKKGK